MFVRYLNDMEEKIRNASSTVRPHECHRGVRDIRYHRQAKQCIYMREKVVRLRVQGMSLHEMRSRIIALPPICGTEGETICWSRTNRAEEDQRNGFEVCVFSGIGCTARHTPMTPTWHGDRRSGWTKPC